jgi:hypothetical protein
MKTHRLELTDAELKTLRIALVMAWKASFEEGLRHASTALSKFDGQLYDLTGRIDEMIPGEVKIPKGLLKFTVAKTPLS